MGISHLISIVGAGPGDPELLTTKAYRRLKEADVVLYDALMGEEILELAKESAEKIYVGKLYKDGQNQTERQDEIHKMFLRFASAGKHVVRLKAGDPMIFGRGAEEIRFCKENGLSYEVIPGITAGIAGASLFGIPLTERGKCGMTLFYTGHRKDGSFADLSAVVEVLKSGSPVVVYMGVNILAEFANELIRSEIEDSTSVHILSKISQKDQRGYELSLKEIGGFFEENNPATPAIVVIGKYSKSI